MSILWHPVKDKDVLQTLPLLLKSLFPNEKITISVSNGKLSEDAVNYLEPLQELKKNGIKPMLDSCAKINRWVGCSLLSRPGKMPCGSFSIPVEYCVSASHMHDAAKTPNAICPYCYAKRGHYVFEVVKRALEKRYRFAMSNDFVPIMSDFLNMKRKNLMRRHGKNFKPMRFRWFDAGDLQSIKMLDDICTICRNTPDIKHWLPTREGRMVKYYREDGNKIPSNLMIRVSAKNIDGAPPTKLARRLGVGTSTVLSKDNFKKKLFKCRASEDHPSSPKGKCGSCSACWDHRIEDVSYGIH